MQCVFFSEKQPTWLVALSASGPIGPWVLTILREAPPGPETIDESSASAAIANYGEAGPRNVRRVHALYAHYNTLEYLLAVQDGSRSRTFTERWTARERPAAGPE